MPAIYPNHGALSTIHELESQHPKSTHKACWQCHKSWAWYPITIFIITVAIVFVSINVSATHLNPQNFGIHPASPNGTVSARSPVERRSIRVCYWTYICFGGPSFREW
ncbi:hypothetical protein BJ878DRAFT_475810 [Calycina marina]|uniref:Uncharacterized protein n=1 Tax=Calycina marina TaxID=1763456 RepID=A0A9P8CJC7_9HELO|nr:hypothetical protein BJ878DRAFT_475810 [Calycina marina]